ncbi:1-deoxy-D-xylulose-5-phosphate reductoisomerase [Hazenella coriacea]|uniref:1-deoxy-D-xylulose 5-phosphate reductoisomerase n=1 Tax=Hazenella coriacea TaxID=1179467 RepID=A0A4R3L1Y5_9BACL|nr:1-deoxy-D-xylulose-5-phosphate reductoisomerase [Hazenella coriacea]TCS93172.1 1-deoxy-D-xylulose 5-phosphate reductoisomerase [Hazenella coriacea]
MLERVVILGSTGSIGTSTLEVIRQHRDLFEVIALAAGTNVSEMVKQVHEFHPKIVSMATQEAAEKVQLEVGDQTKVIWGEEALLEIATQPEATYVVSSLVGSRGLPPTLAAIQAGKKIGIANKETLVTAGHLVTQAAREANVPLLPIDSEHSAIFQCLHGERKVDIERLIVTASGGSFRDWTREQLKEATVEKALKHPNWSMGAKVTIDSATLMNKGLEVIEAHWLFGLSYDYIDVMVHPQSIIHSMIEFNDGAVMAQLGTPDMKVPIQYALTYPHRYPLQTQRLDLITLSRLDFRAPDLERFPCLKMAYDAGRIGGTMTTVLNAANEIAVERFLNHELPFLAIEETVERALEAHDPVKDPTLEAIEEADQWARNFARNVQLSISL